MFNGLVRAPLFALLLLAMPAGAAQFEAGKHFTVISEETTDEPVVMEFFSYGCGGCFQFDSTFSQAKRVLGEQAEFTYVPADFGGGFWTPAQDLFLALDALDLREDLHTQAFAYFHTSRRPVNESTVKTFLAENGVDEEKFEKTLKSFAVHVKEKRYDQLTKRYRIGSTPTVIVNGKYRIEHDALSSSREFVQLVRYLLQNP